MFLAIPIKNPCGIALGNLIPKICHSRIQEQCFPYVTFQIRFKSPSRQRAPGPPLSNRLVQNCCLKQERLMIQFTGNITSINLCIYFSSKRFISLFVS
jgi:hypothetical protein